MKPIKRKQNWALGVEKGVTQLMQTKGGQTLMLGHVIGDYFYTPDIGKDKWEIWNLADLLIVPKQETTTS